jgi:thiosulfate/3-mercaptopyruvate sulfurtransferase
VVLVFAGGLIAHLFTGEPFMMMRLMLRMLAWFLVMVTGPALAWSEEYPKSELLVEPAALLNSKNRPMLILDARSAERYQAGHIPNARWVDHADWAKNFNEGTDTEGWTKRIRQLGITLEQPVVIYDDNQAKDAARIWWILRYWGVQDVRLLNGGFIGWEQAKHSVETTVPKFTPSTINAVPATKRLATKNDLMNAIPKGRYQIVDARSQGEHCGIDAMKNKRAGAMPGAKQLEWSDLVDAKTHRFKPAPEMKKLFDAAGIQLDVPTATHCQSGGRASGATDVKNYYKSWSEWGNADDTPIVVKPLPNKK